VEISIYNQTGQLVSRLASEKKEPGHYTVKWDGRNNQGELLPTGIYFAKFKTDEFIDVKKVLFIK
jgi:flagellar hook assembly protein FlgD